jgi:uncharacterized protein YbjT (DUF2867 family)
MIVIAGGTGRLGTDVVRRLTAAGLAVRVMTRDPTRASHLVGPLVEVVHGDVRQPATLLPALAGATTLISAIQGFSGTGDDSPKTVDWLGNQALLAAAQAAGVTHIILLSVHGAAPDHPMELMRMKQRAEEALQASGIDWTIIRPTAYMETWLELVGAPLVTTGATRLFGQGQNPINFVAVDDVARLVEQSVSDPSLRNQVLDIGGPENLTFREVVQGVQRVTGVTGVVRHVPLPALRLTASVMRPFNATLARQAQAAVVMDTHDMAWDPRALQARVPGFALTRLDDVVRRDYRAATATSGGSATEVLDQTAR